MTAFRCTAKLLKALKAKPALDAGAPRNRLGDWTANVVRYGRKPHVLAVAEHSRLLVVLEAAPYKTLPDRFLEELRHLLRYLLIPDELIDEELAAMRPLDIAKTNSRSVLASLNQYDFMICCWLDSSERLTEVDLMKRGVEQISKPNDYHPAGDVARERFGLAPVVAAVMREKLEPVDRPLH